MEGIPGRQGNHWVGKAGFLVRVVHISSTQSVFISLSEEKYSLYTVNTYSTSLQLIRRPCLWCSVSTNKNHCTVFVMTRVYVHHSARSRIDIHWYLHKPRTLWRIFIIMQSNTVKETGPQVVNPWRWKGQTCNKICQQQPARVFFNSFTVHLVCARKRRIYHCSICRIVVTFDEGKTVELSLISRNDECIAIVYDIKVSDSIAGRWDIWGGGRGQVFRALWGKKP